MENQEFIRIRHYLNKTQKQLGQLLCVSPKAVQSYEQGWRHIPSDIERQLLLLISLKGANPEIVKPCWEIKKCPVEWREKCIIWEYQVRHFCWLVNGTFCQGQLQGSWENKIKICRKCEVFTSLIPTGI
jgi:DNA-binding XRE family transcriptional regulator